MIVFELGSGISSIPDLVTSPSFVKTDRTTCSSG